MKVERTKDEIIIRLPSNTDISELQDMLNYINYIELTNSSKAKQSDVDKLAKVFDSAMWRKIKRSTLNF